MQRRDFLKLGLGSLLIGPASVLADPHPPGLLSCYSNDRDEHFLGLLDAQGQLLQSLRLPARGHGIAIDPARQTAAVFARRPGNFVWLIDLPSFTLRHKIAAAPGRHFYGHGVFSPDGQTLLCSENAFDAGDGVIGIYAKAKRWARSGELASHGIGPHQIGLLGDGNTLVVANGGILTHPDMPRIKRNLDSMQPNLAYIDRRDGRLLRRFEPPARWHQLSIRHIDIAPDDSVAVAMQYQGSPLQQPPLIALQRGEQPLQFLQAPAEIQPRLRNYCGSVRFSRDGSTLAVSSPRGGLVTLWRADGAFLGSHQQADVCGIASDANRFVFSDGGGRLQALGASGQTALLSENPGLHWDNHQLEI